MGLSWGLRFCISDKLPGEADATALETTLHFVPLICVAVFVSVLSCFDSRSFVVQSEIKGHDSSCSVLFLFKIALTIQGVWCLHIQFRIICSHSEKNVMNILIRIA